MIKVLVGKMPSAVLWSKVQSEWHNAVAQRTHLEIP